MLFLEGKSVCVCLFSFGGGMPFVQGGGGGGKGGGKCKMRLGRLSSGARHFLGGLSTYVPVCNFLRWKFENCFYLVLDSPLLAGFESLVFEPPWGGCQGAGGEGGG